jgi:hypothetical protein
MSSASIMKSRSRPSSVMAPMIIGSGLRFRAKVDLWSFSRSPAVFLPLRPVPRLVTLAGVGDLSHVSAGSILSSCLLYRCLEHVMTFPTLIDPV